MRSKDLKYTQNNIIDLKKEHVVDLTEIQLNMEKLFHKNQLHSRIKSEFVNIPKFKQMFDTYEIPENFGYDLLVQMHLHKRASPSVLVGILRKHFKGDSQLIADYCLRMAQANLVDFARDLEKFIVKYELTPDTQKEIDLYQYPLPMLVQPCKIKDNKTSGYLTHNSSVILKNNHHNGDVCLEFLDTVNSIQLQINTNTAAMVKNQWKNLDKPKEDETLKEYKQRVRAFEKYDACTKDVMAHLQITGNKFYLTHRYDKRGRVYCQGYHITYQGTEWNKAVIEFSEGEVVT